METWGNPLKRKENPSKRRKKILQNEGNPLKWMKSRGSWESTVELRLEKISSSVESIKDDPGRSRGTPNVENAALK